MSRLRQTISVQDFGAVPDGRCASPRLRASRRSQEAADKRRRSMLAKELAAAAALAKSSNAPGGAVAACADPVMQD